MIKGRKVNREIEVLNQISHVIVRQKNISLLLKEVLDIFYREIGLQRGTVTLRRGKAMYIEASHGLSEPEMKRGKYDIGEGITGRVAQIAKPIIIPEISNDPNFLDRTQSRVDLEGIAFLCVPIIYEGEVIGTDPENDLADGLISAIENDPQLSDNCISCLAIDGDPPAVVGAGSSQVGRVVEVPAADVVLRCRCG